MILLIKETAVIGCRFCYKRKVRYDGVKRNNYSIFVELIAY
ncbi:MAG: hypothetical protein Q8865_04895 [Bacillota bacterium]|nr:hypothetical protein [Bacillota bacterium]